MNSRRLVTNEVRLPFGPMMRDIPLGRRILHFGSVSAQHLVVTHHAIYPSIDHSFPSRGFITNSNLLNLFAFSSLVFGCQVNFPVEHRVPAVAESRLVNEDLQQQIRSRNEPSSDGSRLFNQVLGAITSIKILSAETVTAECLGGRLFVRGQYRSGIL